MHWASRKAWVTPRAAVLANRVLFQLLYGASSGSEVSAIPADDRDAIGRPTHDRLPVLIGAVPQPQFFS